MPMPYAFVRHVSSHQRPISPVPSVYYRHHPGHPVAFVSTMYMTHCGRRPLVIRRLPCFVHRPVPCWPSSMHVHRLHMPWWHVVHVPCGRRVLRRCHHHHHHHDRQTDMTSSAKKNPTRSYWTA